MQLHHRPVCNNSHPRTSARCIFSHWKSYHKLLPSFADIIKLNPLPVQRASITSTSLPHSLPHSSYTTGSPSASPQKRKPRQIRPTPNAHHPSLFPSLSLPLSVPQSLPLPLSGGRHTGDNRTARSETDNDGCREAKHFACKATPRRNNTRYYRDDDCRYKQFESMSER